MLSSVHDELLSRGFAVIDDFLPAPLAAKLHDGMERLRQGGGLRQHRFGFKPNMAAPVQLFTKPHIFEAEAGDAAVRAIAPGLAEAIDEIDLQRAASDAFPSLRLASGADAATVKLQCNEGRGGCFPLHYDNAGPPSKRALTGLFYLNPDWRDGDGGELQLQPWLRPMATLAPLHRRLVLFLSDRVLHRVLPCHARRYCFTVWLDGEGTNGAGSLSLDSRVAPEELHLLACQRVLSRSVYSEEYVASMEECFVGSAEQLAPQLASHHEHVRASMASAPFARIANAARELKARLASSARPPPQPDAQQPQQPQPAQPSIVAGAKGLTAAPPALAASPVGRVELLVLALDAYRVAVSVRVL